VSPDTHPTTGFDHVISEPDSWSQAYMQGLIPRVWFIKSKANICV